MVTKNQNRPPFTDNNKFTPTAGSPSNKFQINEVMLAEDQQVGVENMVTTPVNRRARKAFSVVNGGHDLSPDSAPPSTAGSECGTIGFTREDVEALLSEKTKKKDRFNYKERCENMVDYIRRLKICIRWFQQSEGSFSLEQARLHYSLESAETKCAEMEALFKNKEDEMNSIIVDLTNDNASLQEKLKKEETDKLAAMESLMTEREARLNSERSQTNLSEELSRAQRDLQSANQKISSLNDMYKHLQDYITSLQQYNGKLQSELSSVEDEFKGMEKEKATIADELSIIKGEFSLSKASQDEAVKQKEILASEVASLRRDLQQVREDRDHYLTQKQSLTAEVMKYEESIEKSCIELENLKTEKAELEARFNSKSEEIKVLQEQLMKAEKKLQVSDLSAFETRMEYEDQRNSITDLQQRLADAEHKLIEGEKLRKKLHNTILELKGNIRVFCRVRPLLPNESCNAESKAVSYPTSMEYLGRGVDLTLSGQKHSFTFDKVFMPDATQEDVFVEISQLVQSALDGYKVCIFAYGQTGSGKTYTMMGRPGHFEEKGLIPRCLEQIFQTRQSLQLQGWKYEMQVSMLEIYNEAIRDLLSTNRQSAERAENGVSGKQYAIKHDAAWNTFVSDLTVVDVCSATEVSFLLNQAANSRSVGKTQMNEQSSRSHFVFTLQISGVNKSTEQQVHGVLNLIDLAGSERLAKSGSTGERLKETQAINKSLSSLGDVIFSLAKKEDHVPYRNSKLTHLLQPCLGGDSKTLMFVNISPDPSSGGESLCSLRFAARVNACEIGTPRRHTGNRP